MSNPSRIMAREIVASEKPFRLLDLPSEIRLAIYSQVFSAQDIGAAEKMRVHVTCRQVFFETSQDFEAFIHRSLQEVEREGRTVHRRYQARSCSVETYGKCLTENTIQHIQYVQTLSSMDGLQKRLERSMSS
jgi:hypothetical protein